MPGWFLSTIVVAACLAAYLAADLLGAAPLARADDDPWFGRDKALHFSLSAVIAGGGYAAAVPITDDRRWRLAAGAGLAIAAGAGKEISDRYDGGDASWRDFTWDLLNDRAIFAVRWSMYKLSRLSFRSAEYKDELAHRIPPPTLL